MRRDFAYWQTADGAVLGVARARGFTRLRGLIGRPTLDPRHAILFDRCRSLHGFGMTRAIDVIFVDHQMRVLEIRNLRPWRIVSCASAGAALELRSGECGRAGIKVGDRFEMQKLRDNRVEFEPIDA